MHSYIGLLHVGHFDLARYLWDRYLDSASDWSQQSKSKNDGFWPAEYLIEEEGRTTEKKKKEKKKMYRKY